MRLLALAIHLCCFLHIANALILTNNIKRIAVAGSTGKVGRLVIQELLATNYTVRAITRDVAKAKAMFPDSDRIEIVKCDLNDARDIASSFKDVDACVWCASGFVAESSWYDKILSLFKLKVTPKKTLEIEGVMQTATVMMKSSSPSDAATDDCPRFILCSSAGVTRPSWSDAKKKRFVGAADIPIVRLNPFGILGLKLEGEDVLRGVGLPYAIVRPCGLNNDWPSGRPILSQGDIAVGRCNRVDIARLLVRLLGEPLSVSKTFECFTVPYYPEPLSYSDQLSRLSVDGVSIDESSLALEYALLQQLVPGETLAPNKLAMGQTYEQLDKGQKGRLGESKLYHAVICYLN